MSNELVRAGQKALVNSEGTFGNEVGKTMALAGGGTLGVIFLSMFVPFVGTFGLAVVLMVLGAYLWAK